MSAVAAAAPVLPAAVGLETFASRPARPHEGMPPLDESGPPLSFFEFWPMWAFYPPVMAYAAWQMLRHRGVLLPTAANPSFPGGGYFGESKAAILALAREHLGDWVAPFVALERRGAAEEQLPAALQALAEAQITLPVVAKPDLGCRGAGVKLVRTAADLQAYLAAFPEGAGLAARMMTTGGLLTTSKATAAMWVAKAGDPKHVPALEKAFEDVRNQGLERGLEQGREQGKTELLCRLLSRRFGPLPAEVETRLARATAADIDAWSLRILDAGTLADVFAG